MREAPPGVHLVGLTRTQNPLAHPSGYGNPPNGFFLVTIVGDQKIFH